ncbi:E3 SUMO-protein ligase RanBP2-like [Mytilus edulis]
MSRRNRKDVDRYVSHIPEKEKTSRGYQISVLYNEAGDYETAKRYLASYISTRENVPQAHKLMGQILESSKNKEDAIESYKRSFQLDSKQKDLLLKICELYGSLKNIDPERAKYWVEQAERFHPNSSVLFRLKERVMSGANFEDLEDFYAKQLAKNYTEVNLHTKLIDLYLSEDKVGNAYRHTVDVEKTLAFVDNIVWYENISRVFQTYQKKERCQADTSFHMHRLIVLCNLVYLQIKEREIVTCAQSLYMLDQSLQEAMMVKSQKPEWMSVLCEVQGMYYFLCGLLLLKRANKGQLVWKDASSFSVVCFLLSYNFPVINRTSAWYVQSKSVQLQKFYDRVYLFGCYRLSQAGYIASSLLHGEASTQLNTQRQQLRTPQARDKLYDVMFTMREMREKKDRSYLIQSDHFCTAQVVVPSKKLVSENDKGVEELFADDLDQLVWMALQKYSVKDQVLTYNGLAVFNKLPFSTDDIDSASLESLCQLDIQAFFLAALRCASIDYEEQRRINRRDQFRPYILPACLCSSLCTSQQVDWWTAMYKFCTGKAKENFPKLRATIQRGLEVIRLKGPHGMSVVSITNIAKSFDQKVKELETDRSVEGQERLTGYNGRAALYWKEVLGMVERLQGKLAQRRPKERMFDDGDSGQLDFNQIQDIKDQAQFSLAIVAMRRGSLEEAKEKLESIRTPWASYYLAKIYRDMSREINSDDIGFAGDKLALMERALDTLYQTLDRLKTHKNHELESIVPKEIDEVVNEIEGLRMPGLALVDSICNGMNSMGQPPDLEGDEENDSDGEYTSFSTPKGKEQHVDLQPSVISPGFVASTPAIKTRTPGKSPGAKQLQFSMETRQHARPSPERLEARIWAIEKKQETVIDLVQDMRNRHTELESTIKGLKDLLLSQRQAPPPPPPQMYPSPYAGSMYRPQYQPPPPPPMMPQPGYGYQMPMSPGPGGRPIPSRVGRTNQYIPQPDIEDEFYDGDFYEDNGSGQGMPGQDTSGWTVNHKPGMEGMSNLGHPSQQMPPAGFFAQALRGQALQFQQGQIMTGQVGRQGPPMMSSGLVSMSSTQSVNSGMYPHPGAQQQSTGMVPGMIPGQSHGQVPGMMPGQSHGQVPSQMAGQVQGQLAELLSTNTCQPRMTRTEIPKPPEPQRPMYGTSQGAQNVGNVSSSSSTPTTLPLLGSLLAASTSPDKPLANPVSMVTSVASGSSAPKGTFSFGQQPTGTQSPFSFGQVSSTTPGGGQNLFTSPQKASTSSPGAAGYIFPSPQKENIFAGKSSRETSPVKSPSKDHTDEYEPNVDFKPVIDLPDLVETKTGEEEEESLFCERAKLFRFDDGQWKERGTGELKLLLHKQTKRVRLLMRRDQVLKVCANHFLTKEMKLSPMQSSKKAWCWNAQDFSEGEITIEKLAVRFKDEDLALRFKTTFEKLQSELDQVQSKPVKKEPAKTVTSDKPSLGSIFKKEEGAWSCPACLVSNKSDVQKCAACQTLKPGLKPEDVIKTESKSTNLFGSTSSGVKFGNTSSEQKSSGFSFQSGTKPTSAADIKFGQTTKAADSTTPATGSGFKFGGQTVSTIKTTTSEADTGKPPLSGGFKFGQLPESDKTKATPGAVSFGQSVSSTSTTEPTKSTIGGFTFQSPKPSGFSFGGETKSDTAKPAATFSFKPSAPMASPSPSATVTEIKNKPVSFKPSTPLGTSTVIPKPEPAKKDEKKGFGNQFKPKEGSWKCNGCLMSNNSDALKCPACQTIKPGVTKEEAKASVQPEKKEGKKGFGDLFKPKEGAWKCDGCLVSNNGDVLKCPACGTLKPGVKKEDLPKETEKSSAFGSTGGGFSFGGKGGFNFGTAGKSDTKAASGFTFPTPDSTKEKSESKPAGFTFTPTKSDAEKNKPDAAAKGFNFTLQPSATPEKGSSGFNFTLSPSKDAGPKSPPTDAEGMYMNKDGDDDHIHFEPIIELPSVVDVVTGEEDEEVLFQHRSKLFRFVDGEWKERGVGDIKISKHKESGKVRLLMRRAQIHKICLNHYLTQELELKPMPKTDGKAWIWFALDFSDGEPAMQQLAVKFKNQEIANGFKKAFDDAKAKLDSSVATQESPVRRVDDSDIRTDGVEFVKEEKATKEQITMARKFFLPDHFYLYENKPSCPGCIGCEDYETGKKISPAKSRIPVKVVADTNSSNAKTNLFGQSRTSDLPKPKSESSVIGSTTVSSSSDMKGGMFGAGATEFSFSSIVKESDTSSGGVFGGGGAFSFSDLAKQADSSTSPGFKVQDHTKQFSWTGTGQQLFSTGAGDGNEEGAEEADDSGYTYDPQYEPIIDLPDLVDTKTGEEDFEEMFRQRAKLFRFDKEANQWKEKGLGEMKILRHLVNSRYRLILRREQVLKLACNQWLTAEISFKPLPTSETSWCWVGQDFSDNEPVIEQLAIKFKTIELAQQFKQVIDTCQNEIRKQNSTATEKGDADIKPTTVVAQPEESRTVVAQPIESRTVVTQPEDAMKNVIEEQAKVEEDEEEDDDDYTTDEDEEEILFDKRIKFFSKEEDWKAVGLGTIKVIYDEDVNGNRIMVELDNKNVVCNHLVTKELNMSIDKKDCYWSPIDFSTDEPVRRHFRSQFSSEQAAQEFQKVFEEGRQLAQESEISERDIATFPHEITFPHAHGGSSQ